MSHSRRRGATLVAVLVSAVGAGACAGDGPDEIVVAAASDLRPVLPSLIESFTADTGIEVSVTFGSSGQLAQQLAEGAPMDLFASADGLFVDRVLEAGRGDEATRQVYAYGRLALWARTDAWQGWDELAEIEATSSTIAIANPEHAPYGRAAREALETAGIWDEVRDRVVYGENVADTLRLAATGNADVAIVAMSLVADGRWIAIDESLHGELRQELVVVAEDPARADAAGRFAAYLLGDVGRAALGDHGFDVP